MIIPLTEAAERYGVQRKSIRQAARRHPEVDRAIVPRVDGAPGVHLDTDLFDHWWNEIRDLQKELNRRGKR